MQLCRSLDGPDSTTTTTTFHFQLTFLLQVSLHCLTLCVMYFSCFGGNYLRLYLHQAKPSINEDSAADEQICGNLSAISRPSFYSSGEFLIIELSVDTSRLTNSRGFKGIFNFLDASKTRPRGSESILRHVQSTS